MQVGGDLRFVRADEIAAVQTDDQRLVEEGFLRAQVEGVVAGAFALPYTAAAPAHAASGDARCPIAEVDLDLPVFGEVEALVQTGVPCPVAGEVVIDVRCGIVDDDTVETATEGDVPEFPEFLSENGFETKILTLVQIPVGSECVIVAGECVAVKFCVAADDIVALTIECCEAQAGFLDGHQVAQFNGVDEFRS